MIIDYIVFVIYPLLQVYGCFLFVTNVVWLLFSSELKKKPPRDQVDPVGKWIERKFGLKI